jgi:hypothetical protein
MLHCTLYMFTFVSIVVAHQIWDLNIISYRLFLILWLESM